MKTLSMNKVAVPADLGSITDCAEGVKGDAHTEEIWEAVLDLYRTGMNPGIGFCLRHKGEVVIDRAIGYASGNVFNDRSVTPKRPLTVDTPVCLYSSSKAVTAMLAHWADENNIINLLDPVANYLPEFAQNGKKNITIQQVLCHKAGIATLPKDVEVETLYDYQRCIEMVCEAEPDKRTRHRWAYHALTGGYVIGAVLERATGKSISELLDEAFRQPLGMKYFTYGLDAEYRKLAAENYGTGIKPVGPLGLWIKNVLGGTFEEAIEASNDIRFMETIAPAGNIYATANEASRFFDMLVQGGSWEGHQVLEPETIRRAVLPTGHLQLDRLLMMPIRYSMGMMLGHKRFSVLGNDTEEAYGHLGMISIVCWADPARELSGALLTTGKALLGTHFKAQFDLMNTINRCY